MAELQNDQVNASLDDDPEDAGEEKSSSSMKMVLLILIPLILIGAGAGAYFTGMIDLGGSGGAAESAPKDDRKAEMTKASFLKIPDIIVNLSSDDGQPRYLRLSVQLELQGDDDKAKIEAVMPRVVDQFQTYLRELRVRDLRGSAGIYRLQLELLSRVNAAAYPVEVQDVLFQEILIQ
ncbi:MAG: flagellar basal body-associated FliL family protein [Pseudomonadota bacterium]